MNRRDALQIFLLSAIWGISFLLIRTALTAMPPMWVSAGRTAFGAITLWLVLYFSQVKLPNKNLLPRIAFVALLNNAVPWTFFALGEQTVTSSIASILNATSPVWTALVAALYWRDTSLGKINIIGVLLGFLGVALAVSGGLAKSSATLGGGLMIVAATLCYGIATNYAKRRLQSVPPIAMATLQLSMASIMLLPLAGATHNNATITTPALAALLLLGILGSGIAFWLYFNLLARLSATQVQAVTYIIPIWGMFWGALAGEPLGWTSFAGVAVVLVGVWLINQPAKSGN